MKLRSQVKSPQGRVAARLICQQLLFVIFGWFVHRVNFPTRYPFGPNHFAAKSLAMDGLYSNRQTVHELLIPRFDFDNALPIIGLSPKCTGNEDAAVGAPFC